MLHLQPQSCTDKSIHSAAPLETPEEAVLVVGAGPFSVEGVVPDLPQKTWVAGIQKVDWLWFYLPWNQDVWVSFHPHDLQFIIPFPFCFLTSSPKDVFVPGVAGSPLLVPHFPQVLVQSPPRPPRPSKCPRPQLQPPELRPSVTDFVQAFWPLWS